MNQSDFFTTTTGHTAFRDIRSTRPSVAEEKARLSLELGKLILTVPQRVAFGSINETREWLSAQKAAKKVASSSRSSVMQLEGAIRDMRRLA